VSVLARSSIVVYLMCLALIGCEDEQLPPPDDEGTSKSLIEIDERFSATVQADRKMMLTNLAFVVQPDPIKPRSMGVSLTTVRPGVDGSRMIFGTFVQADSLSDLTKSNVYLSAGRLLNPYGNGIFTARATYQPKFVALKITGFDDEEVRGTFSGDFYRFLTVRPAMRPEIIKVEATFVAALIRYTD